MRYELKKAYNRSTVLALLLCAVINGYLFYHQQQVQNGYLLAEYPAYMEILEEMAENPKQNLQNILDEEYTPAFAEARSQQAYVSMYPDFILEMPKRAEAASRLSKRGDSAFSERNIEKTTKDFQGMEKTSLQLGPERGLTSVYHFPLSDVLAMAFMVLMCVVLFAKEDTKKLFPLILAVQSRWRVGAHKLAALAVSSGVITLILYGSNIAAANSLYGFGRLGRSVQSLSEFRTCNLEISCLEYLVLGFLMKFAVVLIWGILVLAVFTLLRKAVLVFLVLLCFLGISYGMYAGIEVTSSLNALHFVNVFYLTDSFSILSNYQNINLLGYPFSMTDVMPVVFAFLFAAGTGIVLFCFGTSAVCRSFGQIPGAAKIADLFMKKIDRLNSHGNLFVYEWKKTLWGNRALVILLAMGVWMFYRYDTSFRVMDSGDYAYERLVHEMGGKITEKTLEEIQKHRDMLSQAENPNAYTGEEEALVLIEMQVESALHKQETKGIEPYLIDAGGYQHLMLREKNDIYDSLFLIASAALCCSGIFAKENASGIKKLLRISPGGNRLVWYKCSISVIISIVLAGIIYGSRHAMVAKHYLLEYMDAPVQNIMELSDIPYECSILQYVVALYVLRFIGSVLIGLVIGAVSSAAKNDASAMVIVLSILGIPIVAVGAGISVLKYLSVFSCTGGNCFLQDTARAQIWYSFLGIGVTAGGIFFIKKKWHEGMPKQKRR